ncbi:MAG: hypothetical protein HKN35_12715 [Woeseia sp.]|nr:hypothetical protein [Woeseia sp.]NNE61750.1 hypothetical protein [Woeseia sp.]
MNYQGPQPADFQNVQAFNAAFLVLLRSRENAAHLLAGMPEVLAKRLQSLTPLQNERLSKAPFLLFSFRECEGAYWDQLFNAGPNLTIFDQEPVRGRAYAELLSAGLGFVWQLARVNTYAARLVCGASLHWCEQLADRPLLQVIRGAIAADVMRLRRAHDANLWRKLLFAGVAGEKSIRRSARICALQRLLTETQDSAIGKTAIAARQIRRPALKVAEDNEA